MRIWDIDPGYLARQQLLGEHRELHGLHNILTQGKKGYARHPETLRWVGHVEALCLRHQALVSEMGLRGYQHQSPLPDHSCIPAGPESYIDPPGKQFGLLAAKYAHDGRSGRIPLPANCQQLWAQHKYSVMAHDPNAYRAIGPEVAHGRWRNNFEGLAMRLAAIISRQPQHGHLINALHHMWGYVDHSGSPPAKPSDLLALIRHESSVQEITYLQHSTALCELQLWV